MHIEMQQIEGHEIEVVLPGGGGLAQPAKSDRPALFKTMISPLTMALSAQGMRLKPLARELGRSSRDRWV